MWNHPIDVHFGTDSLSGWPRVLVEVSTCYIYLQPEHGIWGQSNGAMAVMFKAFWEDYYRFVPYPLARLAQSALGSKMPRIERNGKNSPAPKACGCCISLS